MSLNMKKKIVIVDYGLGNLYSIFQACKHFGFDPVLSSNKNEILDASHLILPGVGAFEVAINQLNKLSLVEVLEKYISSGKPLMGVCLGMQLLFEKSYEFGEHLGLGFIKGSINKFPTSYSGTNLRIPHIGWNKILKHNNDWANTPLSDLEDSSMMYFVHSYFASPDNFNEILSISQYKGFEFCSSVMSNNIFGFQFHPEKSAESGLSIYKNFINIK